MPTYSYKHQQWEGTQFIFYMVGIRKVHGGLLIIPKVKTEMHQVLSERCDFVACSIWQNSSEKNFHEFNLFCYRLIVYSRRRSTVTDGWCKYHTSNDPVFAMQKYAIIGYRKELTITEYSLTTSTKVNCKIQKERNLYLVLRLRGDTEHDTIDNVTTKTQNTFNIAHMNTDT